MSKAKRLRLASKITWGIGCGLTFYFIVPNPTLSIATVLIAALVWGVQYVFTQIESLPFEDVLSFELNVSNCVMWLFCLFIIILDVFINLGGINKFLMWVRQSDSANVLYSQYDVTQEQIDGFTKAFNFILSVVSVLASEFLNKYADIIEQRSGKRMNKPNIKEHNPNA